MNFKLFTYCFAYFYLFLFYFLELTLQDEHNFLLNGILEQICEKRAHLVGALRSSQLIHNQGLLSMHYINLKSNSWPIIKAALVGGLFPQLCVVDQSVNRLKSGWASSNELRIDPSSALRNLLYDAEYDHLKSYQSPWIVYASEKSSFYYNTISDCTVIAPLAVAMFAGKCWLDFGYKLEFETQCGGRLSSLICEKVFICHEKGWWFGVHTNQ